jgi:hypothetical protein
VKLEYQILVDSYQGIPLAMPQLQQDRTALAAAFCLAGAKTEFQIYGLTACLKACPDTNPCNLVSAPEVPAFAADVVNWMVVFRGSLWSRKSPRLLMP